MRIHPNHVYFIAVSTIVAALYYLLLGNRLDPSSIVAIGPMGPVLQTGGLFFPVVALFAGLVIAALRPSGEN